MANRLEFTNLRATDFVTPTSRYANSDVVYYKEERYTTFTVYKKQVNTLSGRDTVAVIPPGMEYRPDLVSKQRYGTVDFWWKIMEANNMKDILDFKAGKTIQLPDNVF